MPALPPTMSAAIASNPVTIDNPAALAELVRRCAARNTPLADYGIAHQGVGHAPPLEHIRLQQIGEVIEHYERDLTVRVAAGATLGVVQETLRKSGQFVPIDADDDLTIGEIINHNAYNSLRVGYGSIRDLLLGLRYLDGQGREIHVGGRTVKNVAGYDMTRLLVGSLGELGLIYEATLRTYAIPERVLTVDVRIEDPACIDAILPQWLASGAAPSRLIMGNFTGSWLLRVGYYGRITACSAQLKSLETMLDALPHAKIVGTDFGMLQEDLAELSLRRAWRREASSLVKIVVAPSDAGAMGKALAQSAPAQPKLNIIILPVHGCLYAGGQLDADDTAALDRRIDQLLIDTGGFRVWHARPAGCEKIAPFAPAQPDWPLMRKLKQTMDPQTLFNRGRFISAPTTEDAAS